MKKWYNEPFINHRDWILSNISTRQLTCQQAVILLLIDYYNQQNQLITAAALASGANMDQEEINTVIDDLNKKGYLNIIMRNNRASFIIDGLFEVKPDSGFSADVFKTFESEFGRPLTQREMTMISEWLQDSDPKLIIRALREAMINNKPNVNYIAKIIANMKAGQDSANEED